MVAQILELLQEREEARLDSSNKISSKIDCQVSSFSVSCQPMRSLSLITRHVAATKRIDEIFLRYVGLEFSKGCFLKNHELM